MSKTARAVWSLVAAFLLAMAMLGAALSPNAYREMGMEAGAVDCDGPLVVLIVCVPVLLGCTVALWGFPRAVWRRGFAGHWIPLAVVLALGFSALGVLRAVQAQQAPAQQQSCGSGF